MKDKSQYVRLFWCLTVFAFVGFGVFYVSSSSTSAKKIVKKKVVKKVAIPARLGGAGIPGVGTGPLPDNSPGTPLEITFDVADFEGGLEGVGIDMTANHSWVGDIIAELISPDGTAHKIMHRTGSTTGTSAGDSSNLDGLYGFNDDATGDWWAAAAATAGGSNLPNDDYRTTDSGSGDATDMTAALIKQHPFCKKIRI